MMKTKQSKLKWFSSSSVKDIWKKVSGKEVFIDNDFLNRIYKDEVIFVEFFKHFSSSFLFIDKLVSFEFFQTLIDPKELDSRIKFIKNDLFIPAIMHQSQLTEILKKANLITQIYHNLIKINKSKTKPSFIDLFLAGRMFLSPDNKMLITGNKKDFHSIIFDTIDVITIENEENNEILSFYLLQPNQNKLKKATEYITSNLNN